MPATLYRWIKEYNSTQDRVTFVGGGNLWADDQAMREIEKQLRDLKEENEIPRKAMSIFVKDLK